MGSLSLRPTSLSFRNLRPSIARTPLLRATKAYGQLLGRDFNPLAKLLLLRTPGPFFLQLLSKQKLPALSLLAQTANLLDEIPEENLVETKMDEQAFEGESGEMLDCKT